MSLLEWAMTNVSIWSTALVMLCFCLALTIPTALTVVFKTPMASGSGLPEVITMLNGCKIPGLLDIKTAFVKAAGICVIIVSGLAVGREAPMIHVGAAAGANAITIPWIYDRLVGVAMNRRARATFNIESEVFNNYATMGAAAGIAAAFAAPVSGVVYILEEMATYWPMWMTMQAFVCTSVATFTMQLLAFGSVGSDSNALLGDQMPLAHVFTSRDLPIIILMGIVAGLISSFVVKVCKWSFVTRRRVDKACGEVRSALLNVFLLTVLAVVMAVFVPLAFDCIEDGTEGRQLASDVCWEKGGHGTHISRKLSIEVKNMPYQCGAGFHNEMAMKMHSMPEQNIVRMWSEGTTYNTNQLWVLLVCYLVQMVILPGTKVPMGSTIPTLFIGSIAGRLIGEGLHMLPEGKELFADPGVFSQVGAAGLLAGYTHMSIAVCILIAEAQGTTELIIPMCIACLISRSISMKLAGDSVDHFQVHVKGLFFLEETCPDVYLVSTANDLMEKFWKPVPTKLSPLGTLMFLDQNDGDKKFDALPVVTPNGRLWGLVWMPMLRQAAFEAHKMATSANTALLSLHSFAELVQTLLTNHQLWMRVLGNNREALKSEREQAVASLTSALTNGDHASAESSLAVVKKKDGSMARAACSSPKKATHVPVLAPIDHRSTAAGGGGGSGSKMMRDIPSNAVRHGKRYLFAISKDVNVSNIMDAAPFFFLQNTPIERIYASFVKLNLTMVVIVDYNMRPVGLIRRKQLIEFMKHAHGLTDVVDCDTDVEELPLSQLTRELVQGLKRRNSHRDHRAAATEAPNKVHPQGLPSPSLPPIDAPPTPKSFREGKSGGLGSSFRKAKKPQQQVGSVD